MADLMGAAPRRKRRRNPEIMEFINPRGKAVAMRRIGPGQYAPIKNPTKHRRRRNPAGDIGKEMPGWALVAVGGGLGYLVRMGSHRFIGTNGKFSEIIPVAINVGGGAMVSLYLNPQVGAGMIAVGAYQLVHHLIERFAPHLADNDVDDVGEELPVMSAADMRRLGLVASDPRRELPAGRVEDLEEDHRLQDGIDVDGFEGFEGDDD